MSNLTSDELHHAGRKGMKWGMNIFGRRRTDSGGRFRRDKNADPKNVKIPKKLRKSVDERMREAEFLDMYRSRDNMSTKALKAKIARLEAERKFKELVEAPEKARREALQKKKQARLAFVGKAASAALDVYSKVPSSVVGNGKSGQAAKDAIEAFKKKQEWAKAFKDVPTTMTKFTQSINVGGVDVYIPESVQNRFMIQHAGRKGMKWGMHIFGDPNKRAFNKAIRGTRRVVKAFDKLQKHGRLRDNNILAESESINSVMTKGGVKYNPKIHNSAAMQDIKTIIRNNKILKDRTLGTDKDSMAIEKAANVLNYGTKGNKTSLSKLTSNSTDSKDGLKRESRRLFKEVNSLNKDHRKGRISDADYSKQLKETESRQQKNSKLRGYDAASYSGKGMDPARRAKYNKDSSGKETMSSNIKRYSKPSWDFSGSGPAFSDGIVSNKWKKGAINHFGVNTGEIINGVYIPSNEDILQHYGKKGMKWKKKGEGAQGVGMAGLAPAMQSTPHSQEFNKNTERLSKLYESMTGPTSGKYAEKTKKKRAKIQKEIDELQKKNKKLNAKSEKTLSFYNKPTKHSDSSEDTLLHYGKKGMKWRKKGEGATPGMSPAEMAMAEARAKQDSKSYNYNLKMREEAIKNAIKRGASGKEIRRLQGLQKDDQRKVDMNNRHKEALKKKDRNRSSYSRTIEEVDASNGNKPKFKKYKY